jgi:hypothetical protein
MIKLFRNWLICKINSKSHCFQMALTPDDSGIECKTSQEESEAEMESHHCHGRSSTASQISLAGSLASSTNNAARYRHTLRLVTRLGEFSPNEWLFTLDIYLKLHKYLKHLGYFIKWICLSTNFDEKWVWRHLWRFFHKLITLIKLVTLLVDSWV